MTIEPGQIYLMKFGRPDLTQKKRPVVIMSRRQLNGGNSVVVVPFTTQKLSERKGYPNCVFFSRGESDLERDCVAKADEITVTDKMHIDWKRGVIGNLSSEKLRELINAVRWVLEDPELHSG